MDIGIIGLKMAGKSTLFSSFVGLGASKDGTRSNMGIVNVPDERLDELSEFYNPQKTTHSMVRFEDYPPLDTQVKQDRIRLYEGMKTKEAFVLVVGAFRRMTEDEIVEEFNQARFELIMSDLSFIIKRIEKLEKEIVRIAKNRAAKEKELAFMQRLQPILESERMLRDMEFDNIESAIIINASLLTLKPLCYVINVSEDMDENIARSVVIRIKKLLEANGDNSPVMAVNASLEVELAAMDEIEIGDFMREFGIESPGREKVINAAYELLDLITFFTVGEDECRAWNIRKGGKAIDAAASIHTDLARGFIRAEVIDHKDLIELGSMNDAKKAGKLRLEGKTYEVKDGEITHIMFNV